MKKHKTLVCFVNFYSNIFIKYQLKILYGFNDADLFDLLIIDNSNNKNEFGKLYSISQKYISQYNNLSIFNNNNDETKSSSEQHANAIEIGYYIAKSKGYKYILIMDCDCFCLQKNYIKLLKENIENNSISIIGTPYNLERQSIIKNLPNFPVAFMMMLKIDNLDKELNFQPSEDKSEIENNGKDVGFRLKDIFELQNYLSFEVKTIDKNFFKEILFFNILPRNPDSYYFNNNLFAIHVRKSSRRSEELFQKSSLIINYINKIKWYIFRLMVSRFMFKTIKKTKLK